MTGTNQKIALITGAASGIGRATALALHHAGYTTYATARRTHLLDDLAALGLRTVRLDVTDEASMVAAVHGIEQEHGAVDLLVNNAAVGEMGPIEDIALDRWRREFETNVFGLVRLTQLVLPGMRARTAGHVINVSSMGGEMTFPFAGAYHASKYALEAVSDALRYEVAPFGVRVTVIQPAAVKTALADAAVRSLVTTPDSPYAAVLSAHATVSRHAYEQGIGLETPERIAEVIVEAATSAAPRTRYKIGAAAEELVSARRALSDEQWDAMLRQQYGPVEGEVV